MNWFRDYLPNEQLIVDTSFLINILASGSAPEIFKSLSKSCFVEEKVVREIVRHPIQNLCHLKELEKLESEKFICKVRMTDEEYSQYLLIVQGPLGERLDSGESATLIVAKSRGLAVVIDENKARSFVRQKMPNVQPISTLKLFISASYRLNRDFIFLQKIVKRSLLYSKMGVPKDEKDLLISVLNEGQSQI